MRTLPYLLLGLGLTLGACASESAYKVRDANGWPVSTWNARHLDVLVLDCPRTVHTLPKAGAASAESEYYTVDSARFPLVLGVEQRREYERRFCMSPELALPGEPTTVRIALHQKRVPEIQQVQGLDRSPQASSPTVDTTPSSRPSAPVALGGLSASSR